MRLLQINTNAVVILISILLMISGQIWAAEWPDSTNISGFTVSGIKGTANSDGSGSGTGNVNLPGIGSKPINLTRSSSGEITGTTSFSVSLSGADISGSFRLDNSGFIGKGTVKCSPKHIEDASISISTEGGATGSGNVSFGAVKMPARFDISGGSFGLSGTVPVKVSADNTLANYEFSGKMELSGSGGQMALTANGTVRRTGKLSSQVTEESVSNISINPSSGQSSVTVGGVAVSFSFFNP